MNDDLSDPVTAAEAEAARRLARALEGEDGAGADPGALAVVRLLASLRERPEDEVACRRGALDATAQVAAAARGRRARRLLVPLAAALVLAAGLSGRRPTPIRVSEDLLAAREAEARAAVAGLASGVEEFRSARTESLLADLSTRRFEALRAARLASPVASADPTPIPAGTPEGGRT